MSSTGLSNFEAERPKPRPLNQRDTSSDESAQSVPLQVYNNVYEPSNLYGQFRYYNGSRGDLTVDPEPSEIYSHTTSFKYDTDGDPYDLGDKFKRGTTCRVVLCVILVLSLIGVVTAGVVLSVLLSHNNFPRKISKQYASSVVINNITSTPALIQTNSHQYRQLAKTFCNGVHEMFTSSFSPFKEDFKNCLVLSISIGRKVKIKFQITKTLYSDEGTAEHLGILKYFFQRTIAETGPWNLLRMDETSVENFVETQPTEPPRSSILDNETPFSRKQQHDLHTKIILPVIEFRNTVGGASNKMTVDDEILSDFKPHPSSKMPVDNIILSDLTAHPLYTTDELWLHTDITALSSTNSLDSYPSTAVISISELRDMIPSETTTSFIPRPKSKTFSPLINGYHSIYLLTQFGTDRRTSLTTSSLEPAESMTTNHIPPSISRFLEDVSVSFQTTSFPYPSVIRIEEKKPLVTKTFESSVTINGRFHQSLLDPNSPQFLALQLVFCSAINDMLTSPSSEFKDKVRGCEVLEFSEGSIVIRYRLGIESHADEDTLVLGDALRHFLQLIISRSNTWNKLEFDKDSISTFIENSKFAIDSSVILTEISDKIFAGNEMPSKAFHNYDVTTKSIAPSLSSYFTTHVHISSTYTNADLEEPYAYKDKSSVPSYELSSSLLNVLTTDWSILEFSHFKETISLDTVSNLFTSQPKISGTTSELSKQFHRSIPIFEIYSDFLNTSDIYRNNIEISSPSSEIMPRDADVSPLTVVIVQESELSVSIPISGTYEGAEILSTSVLQFLSSKYTPEILNSDSDSNIMTNREETSSMNYRYDTSNPQSSSDQLNQLFPTESDLRIIKYNITYFSNDKSTQHHRPSHFYDSLLISDNTDTLHMTSKLLLQTEHIDFKQTGFQRINTMKTSNDIDYVKPTTTKQMEFTTYTSKEIFEYFTSPIINLTNKNSPEQLDQLLYTNEYKSISGTYQQTLRYTKTFSDLDEPTKTMSSLIKSSILTGSMLYFDESLGMDMHLITITNQLTKLPPKQTKASLQGEFKSLQYTALALSTESLHDLSDQTMVPTKAESYKETSLHISQQNLFRWETDSIKRSLVLRETDSAFYRTSYQTPSPPNTYLVFHDIPYQKSHQTTLLLDETRSFNNQTYPEVSQQIQLTVGNESSHPTVLSNGTESFLQTKEVYTFDKNSFSQISYQSSPSNDNEPSQQTLLPRIAGSFRKDMEVSYQMNQVLSISQKSKIPYFSLLSKETEPFSKGTFYQTSQETFPSKIKSTYKTLLPSGIESSLNEQTSNQMFQITISTQGTDTFNEELFYKTSLIKGSETPHLMSSIPHNNILYYQTLIPSEVKSFYKNVLKQMYQQSSFLTDIESSHQISISHKNEHSLRIESAHNMSLQTMSTEEAGFITKEETSYQANQSIESITFLNRTSQQLSIEVAQLTDALFSSRQGTVIFHQYENLSTSFTHFSKFYQHNVQSLLEPPDISSNNAIAPQQKFHADIYASANEIIPYQTKTFVRQSTVTRPEGFHPKEFVIYSSGMSQHKFYSSYSIDIAVETVEQKSNFNTLLGISTSSIEAFVRSYDLIELIDVSTMETNHLLQSYIRTTYIEPNINATLGHNTANSIETSTLFTKQTERSSIESTPFLSQLSSTASSLKNQLKEREQDYHYTQYDIHAVTVKETTYVTNSQTKHLDYQSEMQLNFSSSIITNTSSFESYPASETRNLQSIQSTSKPSTLNDRSLSQETVTTSPTNNSIYVSKTNTFNITGAAEETHTTDKSLVLTKILVSSVIYEIKPKYIDTRTRSVKSKQQTDFLYSSNTQMTFSTSRLPLIKIDSNVSETPAYSKSPVVSSASFKSTTTTTVSPELEREQNKMLSNSYYWSGKANTIETRDEPLRNSDKRQHMDRISISSIQLTLNQEEPSIQPSSNREEPLIQPTPNRDEPSIQSLLNRKEPSIQPTLSREEPPIQPSIDRDEPVMINSFEVTPTRENKKTISLLHTYARPSISHTNNLSRRFEITTGGREIGESIDGTNLNSQHDTLNSIQIQYTSTIKEANHHDPIRYFSTSVEKTKASREDVFVTLQGSILTFELNLIRSSNEFFLQSSSQDLITTLADDKSTITTDNLPDTSNRSIESRPKGLDIKITSARSGHINDLSPSFHIGYMEGLSLSTGKAKLSGYYNEDENKIFSQTAFQKNIILHSLQEVYGVQNTESETEMIAFPSMVKRT